MQKVKYKCKGCSWTKEMPGDWADVKPRFCPTPSCEMSLKKSKGRKSFRSHPEMLDVTFKNTMGEPPVPNSIPEYIPEEIVAKEDTSNGRKQQQRRSEKTEA